MKEENNRRIKQIPMKIIAIRKVQIEKKSKINGQAQFRANQSARINLSV